MPSALILGCAECVWDDARRALEIFEPDAIFAVKDMIAKWHGRIDYGICLHPERTSGYVRERSLSGLPTNFEVWAHKNTTPSFSHRVAGDWAGSSGLFAVRVAMLEGFDRIVLAGVPMSRESGHVGRKQPWGEAEFFRNGWMHRMREISPHVRSMSGWTMSVLGEPTRDWLEARMSASGVPHEVAAEEGEGRCPS